MCIAISQVRYIKPRGFRVKISNFSRFSCLSIPKRDLAKKKTTPNIEVWPESLGAKLEYLYIERGPLSTMHGANSNNEARQLVFTVKNFFDSQIYFSQTERWKAKKYHYIYFNLIVLFSWFNVNSATGQAEANLPSAIFQKGRQISKLNICFSDQMATNSGFSREKILLGAKIHYFLVFPSAKKIQCRRLQ